jgi:hypothetical protein
LASHGAALRGAISTSSATSRLWNARLENDASRGAGCDTRRARKCRLELLRNGSAERIDTDAKAETVFGKGLTRVGDQPAPIASGWLCAPPRSAFAQRGGVRDGVRRVVGFLPPRKMVKVKAVSPQLERKLRERMQGAPNDRCVS